MTGEASEHNPFTPPKASFIPTLLIAAAIAVGGWAVVRFQTSDLPAVADQQVEKPKHPSAPTSELRPPPSPAQIEPSTKAATPAWTRCKLGERVVYSDRGCESGVAQRNAENTQASISTVPAWEQKGALVERTRPLQAVQRSVPPVSRVTKPDPKRECKELDEDIKQMDVYTRQALSSKEQDRVRGFRKAARDRQFALRC